MVPSPTVALPQASVAERPIVLPPVWLEERGYADYPILAQ
jgi:hypothetical protein